jgi:hypothetical protein
MKKIILLFAIVALISSCKKEETPTPTPTPTASTPKLFNAVYTYGEQSLYLGFFFKVNGVNKTVPVNVYIGDVLLITAHDNLDNGYMISTLLDGSEFDGGMYGFASMHYGSYTWTYTVN